MAGKVVAGLALLIAAVALGAWAWSGIGVIAHYHSPRPSPSINCSQPSPVCDQLYEQHLEQEQDQPVP